MTQTVTLVHRTVVWDWCSWCNNEVGVADVGVVNVCVNNVPVMSVSWDRRKQAVVIVCGDKVSWHTDKAHVWKWVCDQVNMSPNEMENEGACTCHEWKTWRDTSERQ